MKLFSVAFGAFRLLALTSMVATSAQAAVVFSQAPNTVGGPYSQSTQQLADNFSVSGGAVINGAKWWGDNYGGGPFASFTVMFFADTGNGPGSLLASQVVNPTIVDTGVIDSYGRYIQEFNADFSSISVSSGTSYFFSVIENAPNHFTWTQSSSTPGEWISNDGSSWWDAGTDRSGATAYSLFANASQQVPEPSSILLVGLAVAALRITRARKQKAA